MFPTSSTSEADLDQVVQPFPEVIKVCGVTRKQDLEMLKDQGVNCVGLNQVMHSKRYVPLGRCIQLAEFARTLGLKTVVVLMDPSAYILEEVTCAFPWDFVQLHGSELPELVHQHCELRIIKATSWSGRQEEIELTGQWYRFAETSISSKRQLSAWLIDAFSPGVGGGTGKTARWDLVYPRPNLLANFPVILAGGLTPDNVATAMLTTRTTSVDVASGVESEPGIKCANLVARFVAQVKMAREQLGSE